MGAAAIERYDLSDLGGPVVPGIGHGPRVVGADHDPVRTAVQRAVTRDERRPVGAGPVDDEARGDGIQGGKPCRAPFRCLQRPAEGEGIAIGIAGTAAVERNGLTQGYRLVRTGIGDRRLVALDPPAEPRQLPGRQWLRDVTKEAEGIDAADGAIGLHRREVQARIAESRTDRPCLGGIGIDDHRLRPLVAESQAILGPAAREIHEQEEHRREGQQLPRITQGEGQ